MTRVPAVTNLLFASQDELAAVQLRLPTGAEEGMDTDPLLSDAVALCIAADAAFVTFIAAAHPREPADVIIARYRRRWKGRLIRWGVVGPLAFVGLLLLGVVVVTLVTAFIWRP